MARILPSRYTPEVNDRIINEAARILAEAAASGKPRQRPTLAIAAVLLPVVVLSGLAVLDLGDAPGGGAVASDRSSVISAEATGTGAKARDFLNAGPPQKPAPFPEPQASPDTVQAQVQRQRGPRTSAAPAPNPTPSPNPSHSPSPNPNPKPTPKPSPTAPPNQAPTISLSRSPSSCHPTCTVTFTASAADPDGDPLTYAWSGCASGTGTSRTCQIVSVR